MGSEKLWRLFPVILSNHNEEWEKDYETGKGSIESSVLLEIDDKTDLVTLKNSLEGRNIFQGLYGRHPGEARKYGEWKLGLKEKI